MTSTGATFVSDGGTITLGGASTTKSFQPYRPELPQAFSTRAGCTTDGVTISSSNHRVTVRGVIYVPNGRVRIQSSATLTNSSGSIEGFTVQGLNTSRVTIGALPATITWATDAAPVQVAARRLPREQPWRAQLAPPDRRTKSRARAGPPNLG